MLWNFYLSHQREYWQHLFTMQLQRDIVMLAKKMLTLTASANISPKTRPVSLSSATAMQSCGKPASSSNSTMVSTAPPLQPKPPCMSGSSRECECLSLPTNYACKQGRPMVYYSSSSSSSSSSGSNNAVATVIAYEQAWNCVEGAVHVCPR